MAHKSLLFAVTFVACLVSDPISAQEQPGPGRGQAAMGGMMGMMMGRLPDTMPSAANPLTPAKVNLGRMLFYDARLSRGRDVSCNSCHNLENYGVDGKAVSSGYLGQLGDRNSPTVYNAAGHFVQFWDGRALDVEAQAKGPVLNPVEMAMVSEKDVVDTLRSIKGYRPLFQRAFPESADPVSFDNMALAIGAFERKLVTPSRWDRFMKGEQVNLTADEMAGHHQFMHSGCAGCHTGPFIGGGKFQKLGRDKEWPNTSDPGRMAVTKDTADLMVFKVPSLRNVEKTGPYFHNGKVKTLEEAVRLMGEYQLGTNLNDVQVRQIVAWLKTLTGEIPTDYIRAPQLPE